MWIGTEARLRGFDSSAGAGFSDHGSSYTTQPGYLLDLEGRVLSLPMIIPVLIEFLRFPVRKQFSYMARSIEFSKLRLRLLLGLKSASLSGFCSREALMGLPCWQTCFVELVLDEKRISFFGKTDHERRELLSGSTALCAVVHHLLTDLHLHAIRFGSPEAGLVVVQFQVPRTDNWRYTLKGKTS